ncbi:hypothetical protein PTKIN_Ptkin04bG0241600 [Pterospermum kingtungense]
MEEMQQQGGGGEEYLQYQIQDGVIGKPVMTEEQIEELRRQIVAYKVISEQLAQTYKAMAAPAHHDFTGISAGNLYCDPIPIPNPIGTSVSVGNKITARQRWSPTPLQLQTLESIYNNQGGGGIPTKQKIKELAAELAQHGPISETNVYNWFQNRRARSKRKQQQHASGSTNEVSEPDAKDLATEEQRTKPVTLQFKPEFVNNPTQAKPASLEFVNNPTQAKPATLEFVNNSTQGVESFRFQTSDAGIEQLIGKAESSEGYDAYNLVEEYGLLD